MIRFAIFAAVSTRPQAAADKISLPEQIKLCRTAGTSHQWKETTGPFIISGETRTQWINLRDAEEQITNTDGSHPLRDLLDAAKRREYDVLILYHYNRLRELLEPVAKTLQAYGVQMTSISQWTEPQAPETYDPLSDISAAIRFASSFASTAEITELRRRYRQGMPGRVLKGYHVGNLPYGYRKPPGRETDRKATPEPDPITSLVVIRIKDQFLTGASLWQIADKLNAEDIPTRNGKRWACNTVRSILKNNYYAGYIYFGKLRRTIDPRNGKRKMLENPPEKMITAKGLHAPLWSTSTQTQIENEFKRRGKKYNGKRTNRLSNLFVCGICGAPCWGGYSKKNDDSSRFYYCSKNFPHVHRLEHDDLLPEFIRSLSNLLTTADSAPIPAPQSPIPGILSSIAELETRRDRLTQAYLTGAMELPEYTANKTKLQNELKSENEKLTNAQAKQHTLNQRSASITAFRSILQDIPNYITHAPAIEVNAQLRAIISHVTITQDTLTIVLNP